MFVPYSSVKLSVHNYKKMEKAYFVVITKKCFYFDDFATCFDVVRVDIKINVITIHATVIAMVVIIFPVILQQRQMICLWFPESMLMQTKPIINKNH